MEELELELELPATGDVVKLIPHMEELELEGLVKLRGLVKVEEPSH